MSRKALTLIEVLMVVTLVAIATLLVLPVVRVVRTTIERMRRARKLRARRAQRRTQQRVVYSRSRLHLRPANGSRRGFPTWPYRSLGLDVPGQPHSVNP
jgi:prepilin-type N-terminal cleavage/methylation domain-containing protein